MPGAGSELDCSATVTRRPPGRGRATVGRHGRARMSESVGVTSPRHWPGHESRIIVSDS